MPVPPDEGTVALWLSRTTPDLFTHDRPVLFDPYTDHGVRLTMLKDSERHLHVRVEGLPGRVYSLSGAIPPVDRHGLFVCVRWSPTTLELFLGQTLAQRVIIAVH
jgi:hypothetical protein